MLVRPSEDPCSSRARHALRRSSRRRYTEYLPGSPIRLLSTLRYTGEYVLCEGLERVRVQRFLRMSETLRRYAAYASLTRANYENGQLRRTRFAVGSWFFHSK